MDKIKNNVLIIEEKLKQYNPVTVNYGADLVTGFVNDINGSDLIIYYKETEMIMTFGFQNAHFAIDDVDSLIIHTEKYLTSEYSSVEFFSKTKDLFGGSRPSKLVDFSSIDKIVDCYTMGNEKAKQGLYEFLKNTPVTIRAINFDNTVNKVVNVSYKNNEYVVDLIRD